MKKNNKGVTEIKKGIVTKTEHGETKNVTSPRQVWAEEAKCGCGINCCEGTLTLSGRDGTAAEGKFFTIAINDAGTGVVVTEIV